MYAMRLVLAAAGLRHEPCLQRHLVTTQHA